MFALRKGFPAGIGLIFLYLLLPYYIHAQKDADALVLYREGRYKESASVCLNEIERMPRNIDSYVVLTWALLADERYQEAADWTVKGRAVSQYDPRLIESHAQALYHLGRNEESLHLFEDYIASENCICAWQNTAMPILPFLRPSDWNRSIAYGGRGSRTRGSRRKNTGRH